jgi:hypothetical protein
LELCEQKVKATPSEDPVEVRLMDNIAGVSLNETLQRKLWPQASVVAAAPPQPKKQTPPDVPMWSQCRYSPNLTNEVMVYVQFQYSATLYHVVSDEDTKDLDRFQEILTKDCEANGKPLTRPPVIDQIVIGRYEGQYYRGRVTKVEDVSCVVAFVDFGDKSTCQFSELLQASDDIMKFPIYGMMIHLYKVPEPANPTSFVPDQKTESVLSDCMILELKCTKDDLVPIKGRYHVEGQLWDPLHKYCVNDGITKTIKAQAAA